jgi:peptidyl-prolyl cis-trans isomerase SurA
MPTPIGHCRPVLHAAAVLALALAVAASPLWDTPSVAQTTASQKAIAKPAKADKASALKGEQADKAGSPKGEQAIVVLVNDDPITAYEIEQRANLIALSSGGGGGPELKAKAEARWAEIVKDPKTSERFQELLREKNVRTREEAQAVQKQYLTSLQQTMIEQIKRESRASALPKLRKEAREELIEERLRLQEAKKLGIEIPDDDVKTTLKGLAERNKMTYDQFAQHLKGLGVNITTMGERMRGQMAWRQAMQRRYGAQITVTQGDIDRMLSSTAAEAGEDTLELQVQKIALPVPGKADQTLIAKRFADAEALRRKFNGCKSMGDLAKGVADARFEDMKFIKPSSIAEPTRSMLLSAKDGDILPPSTSAGGVEVYAVCSRRTAGANDAQRNKAKEELQVQQFDILAKRHMRNIRQDASIEYR